MILAFLILILAATQPATRPASQPGDSSGLYVYTSPYSAYYHMWDCKLIQGADVERMDVGQASAGKRACRMCFGGPAATPPVASRPATRPASFRATPAEVREAVKAGKVIVGMSLAEARRAMKGAKESHAGNEYTWTTYKDESIQHNPLPRRLRTGSYKAGTMYSGNLTQRVPDKTVTAIMDRGIVVEVWLRAYRAPLRLNP